MKEDSPKSRILIVDDNAVNIRLLKMILEREGFEVIFTGNGLETVDLALKLSPDLILLDLLMPEVSGMEILRTLKMNNVTQGMPVVMVTARTSGEDVRQALEAGAFDYIKKPLDEVEIVARVRSALRYKVHQDRLEEMAMRDSLTGLYNHRLLIELLERELATARRKLQSVSFCMADIDHFKKVNDRFGHQSGDLVLQEVSRILMSGLRKSDPIGRYGGEEFGLVLTSCTPEKAQGLCERLRSLVAGHAFVLDGEEVRVTLSMGLAHAEPGSDIKETDLIQQADNALYRAKAEGRNRLVC
jgi:diguanylate cyclase (GGDEF)-like protein